MMNTQTIKKLYRLTGRYLEGTNVIGYQLMDYMGNILNLKKEDVEKLANEEVIENCRLIIYNNEPYLKGIGIRLSELPILDTMTGEIKDNRAKESGCLYITNRLMDKTNVIGYIVKDNTGRPYRLSKEKVWQLAREKAINNAVAQICGGHKILRGVGIELRNLPAIQIYVQK